MQTLFGFHLMKGYGETITDKMIVEKWGHLAKHRWYRKDKGLTKGKDKGANFARQDSDDYDDMVVMAAVADEHVESKIWFLGSCYSNHMIGKKVWLVDFYESKKSRVKLAENSSLKAEGTGNIVIQGSNGAKALIKDILDVPRMKCNLLSCWVIGRKGVLGGYEIWRLRNFRHPE
ncbi:uncharacterized protein LOC127123451 [Lathyrus oleraceus]|uniref:uncharacterized protein LOC127123451 n=1 Tax=Pisum sativum TaxID=3888 RepID=UPI0021D0D4BC|nr:uncharacterized protein LOC127123451 [Pisum sativum]